MLALAVRLWRLDEIGFNSDEAVYGGQAASLAGNPQLRRAVPGVPRPPDALPDPSCPRFFRTGEVDIAGRAVSPSSASPRSLAVHLLGQRLYGWRVGLLAALLVALMPYHVVVTRQVLLDGR